MGKAFFYVDIAVALAILAFFAYMRYSRRFSAATWLMFWAGVLIGATWEIGFYFLGPRFSSSPLYVFSTEPPYPPLILHVAHCFWDGGLFMAGAGLVRLLLKPPHLVRFRWPELGIMLVWGVAQEIVVELFSIYGGLWLYRSRPYNPSLFEIRGSPFTLLPILVWVAAPPLFYAAALGINRKRGEGLGPGIPAGKVA